MPKIQIGNEDLNAARKTAKQAFKLNAGVMDEAKILFPEFEIEGIQQLFDFLVVSGVIFLKKDVIDIVKNDSAKYLLREKAKNGEAKKTEHHTVFMYPPDLQAFNRFCIEMNIKKFWVIEILVDAFIRKEPAIIEHIKQCQRLNVTERKKQIVRLLKDEYIDVLPVNDANQLLTSFTEKYDKNQFGESVQEEVVKFHAKKAEVEQEEKDLEPAMDAKMARIAARRAAMARIDDPVE